MDHLVIACGCGLDPASEAFVVQSGLAVALAVPFWFRDRILGAARRFVGRRGEEDHCPIDPADPGDTD
jgi:hypothetical protein